MPDRTSSLVVSGQVYLVGGEVKAQSGLAVSVSVDDTTSTAITDSTGSYSVSLGDGIVSIAKTKSKVIVTINDGSEDRVSESERLTVEQVVASQLSIDVTTNLKQTTNVLAVSGSVTLEDGVTLAGSGLEVSVKNTSTGISTKVMTESNGGFSATFFDPLSVVAETDNQIEISIIDVDQATYTQAHVITSKEALDGQVSVELKTPFPGRNTTSLISGTVYREGGEIILGVNHRRVDEAITDFFCLPKSVMEMDKYEDDNVILEHYPGSYGMSFVKVKSPDSIEKFKNNVDWEEVFKIRNELNDICLIILSCACCVFQRFRLVGRWC